MSLNYEIRDLSTRDTSPLLLTTGPTPLSVVISAGPVVGPPVLFPTRDLVNPLRVPIEITELHFVSTESLPANPTANLTYGLWEVSLAVGQHLISTWCPLKAMEVRRDTGLLASLAEGVAARGPVIAWQTRWILPQPLILKPNEGFSGMARITPNLTPQSLATATLSMVARGRRLPAGTPVPARRAIPYASGWIFTQANVPAPDQTFYNPFQTVLHVAALTAQGTSTFALSGGISATINGPGGLANTVIRGVVSPSPLAGANTGMGLGIWAERGAVEEAHDLEPGEMYQISLSAVSVVVGAGSALALLGWREE